MFVKYDYLTIWLCLDYRTQQQFAFPPQIADESNLFSNRVKMSVVPSISPTARPIFNDISIYKENIKMESIRVISGQDPTINNFIQFIELQITG